MASSISEKSCSSPIHCQICDISSDLKWLCYECDLYFCANCDLKFHGKNKILAGHTKINIEHCRTENITELIRKAEVENITCSLHKEQICDKFCRDCHYPICKRCVSTDSHKSHELTSIEDMLNEKIIEKKDFQNRIESYFNHYTQTVNELEFMLEKATEKYNRTKENILNTEKQFNSATENYVKSLEKNMESELNKIEKKVKDEIKVVDGIKSQLFKEEELSQAITPMKMLTKKYPKNLFYQVNDSVYHQKLTQTFFKIFPFQRGSLITWKIKNKLRGNFLKGPDFNHITSFRTKLKGISKLLPIDNCKAMIASYKDEILQKIQFEKSEIKDEQKFLETKVADMDSMTDTISDNQFEKSEIKDEQELWETDVADMDIMPNTISDNEFEGSEIFVEQELSKTKVFDMDIMPNGNILLSVQECELKLLKGKDIIAHASFHSFSPLKTFGIHVSKNNEIIVGISAGFPDKEDKKPKPGKIVVLNLEGIVKRIHEFDKEKYWRELCVCPTRIVTNQDNTICFIDIFKKSYYRDQEKYNITSLENKGKVVGIDQEGELKWTYNGNDSLQRDLDLVFCPKDIAIIYSTGCILIYEFLDDYRICSSAIHIISQNGNTIGYSELYKTEMSSEIKDLRFLKGVAMDKGRKLYLWEEREHYYSKNTKIHVLEFR